jgi:hypothetical protein
MVAIITILYLLTGLLGVYAHAHEDIDVVSAASDLPGQQVIYPLGSCGNGTEPVDEYEPIRKELIVNAATVVTRLTQYPRAFQDECEGCPPDCPQHRRHKPPCKRLCCSIYSLSAQVAEDLEKLIALLDQFDDDKDQCPDHQHMWQEA